MEVIGMPSSMIIIIIVIELLKLTFKNDDKFLKFIPIISALLGVVLGIIQFYAIPAIAPSDNIFHNIIFGIFSGLSAIGGEDLVLQIKNAIQQKKIKQLDKDASITTDSKQNEVVDNQIGKEENFELVIEKENQSDVSNTITGGDK